MIRCTRCPGWLSVEVLTERNRDVHRVTCAHCAEQFELSEEDVALVKRGLAKAEDVIRLRARGWVIGGIAS